ncbi:hypothetical protein ACLOJK_034506 [Asimina triloba]
MITPLALTTPPHERSNQICITSPHQPTSAHISLARRQIWPSSLTYSRRVQHLRPIVRAKPTCTRSSHDGPPISHVVLPSRASTISPSVPANDLLLPSSISDNRVSSIQFSQVPASYHPSTPKSNHEWQSTDESQPSI